ncbi:MAG: hypothetical protein AB1813_17465 [Verrucomicrobiota bacterium]
MSHISVGLPAGKKLSVNAKRKPQAKELPFSTVLDVNNFLRLVADRQAIYQQSRCTQSSQMDADDISELCLWKKQEQLFPFGSLLFPSNSPMEIRAIGLRIIGCAATARDTRTSKQDTAAIWRSLTFFESPRFLARNSGC